MRNSNLRIIVGQVAWLASSVVALYLLTVAASLLILRPTSVGVAINTRVAEQTIYMTSAKLVYLHRSALERPGRKVLLLGASNIVVGVDPARLQPKIPGFTVHNLGLGSANITEVAQVADLALSRLPKGDVSQNVFVFGVWYGVFDSDAVRWKREPGAPVETDIDRERYRYGFAKKTPIGSEEVVPDRYVDLASYAVYPLLAVDKAMRLLTAGARGAMFVRPPDSVTDETRNTQILDPAAKAAAISYRLTDMGGTTLSSEQFDVLDRLVRHLRAAGAKVVVANLPIPAWHARSMPFEAAYRPLIANFASRHVGDPGFAYVDLSSLDADDNFYDEVHPRPRSVEPWLNGLAQAVLRIDAAPPQVVEQGKR